MVCFGDRFDTFLGSCLRKLKNGEIRSDERQSFSLPGAEPKYAPDRTVDVTHILLDLTLDIEERRMDGICTLSFTVISGESSTVELDAAEMEILQVEDPDGNPLDFEHIGKKLKIFPIESYGKGESASLSIHYLVEEPRLGLYFVLPDEEYPDRPVQAWTQGQDNDSRYWFPCFDYPNEKATSETIITVDERFFALSNGKLLETTHDTSSGTRTYHWKQSIPHVSYLISIVAGEFVEHTAEYDGIPVSYYVPPGREEDGERAFGKTPDMIRFFSEKLEFPYPYEKYAQIAVEDFVFGGMENTTATTQTARTLHDERAHLDYESEPLVAHELAHQWFGNLVTCKDWSHAWLNEGFATYLEALYRGHDLGDDEFRYAMDRNAERYFTEDKQYRRPVVTNRYREPIDLFDRHIYEKGSLVLHCLRSVLGDGEFWNVLRTYLERFQQQSVETIDLIRTVESVTGKNMKKFFDQWIFGAGYPEFKVKYAWERDENGSGGTAKITVIQQQEEDNTAEVFDLPVEMRFLVEGQQRKERVHLHEREMTFHFQFSVQPEQFHFDPGNWILKQLDLKIPQKMLLSQLHSADGAMMRIQAARALEDEPTARVVDALADRLHRDAFWGVRAEIAKTLGKMKTDRALDVLIGGLQSEHPKVRRAVVEALGEFHEEKAARALEPYAHEDPSYFVEASANKALGKMRMTWTAELLRNSLEKESFNEVIRGGALAGLAHLDQEEVIDSLLKYIEWGKPQLARAAAAVALGNTHFQHRRIRTHLLELLSPREHFRVKFGAITGLQQLNDPATVPELKSFAGREPHAILQRLAMITARTIQQRQGESSAVRDLREEVDRIRSERRGLINRIEKLESGMNRN